MLGGKQSYLIFATVLFFAFVNPYIENLEFSQPIPYMFAHYSLFISGIFIGYSFLRLPKILAIVTIALSILWHLPYPFALAASLWLYRILEEASFLISGIILGATITNFSWRSKGILLALWVFADNLLSVIFIIAPNYYSSEGIAASPYSNSQFPILGLAMILLMNSLVGLIVYLYTRRMIASIRKVD